MARRAYDTLTELRRKLFVTPTESKEAAQRQLDRINLGLAEQRRILHDSIMELVTEQAKTTHRHIELKLTINRKTLETCIGEQAAVEIGAEIARRLIERHRALTAIGNTKEKVKA